MNLLLQNRRGKSIMARMILSHKRAVAQETAAAAARMTQQINAVVRNDCLKPSDLIVPESGEVYGLTDSIPYWIQESKYTGPPPHAASTTQDTAAIRWALDHLEEDPSRG